MDDMTGLTPQHAWHAAGIPYPFDELPALGEPFADARLMDTLVPLLEGLAALTRVLAVARLEEMTLPQVQDALRLLVSEAVAAPIILRRWWDARGAGN